MHWNEIGENLRFMGENKIQEILLLDDMYKKSVLWDLTRIKFEEDGQEKMNELSVTTNYESRNGNEWIV